jgi:hypothetical protein
MALFDEASAIGCVLHDPMCVHEVEDALGNWQPFSVANHQASMQSALLKVRLSESYGRLSNVYACNHGSILRESGEIGSRSASHFQHAPTARLGERY